MDNLDLSNFSKEEREAILKILKEYEVNGKSETYNELKYNDFDEIPVDIHTFLHDKKYIGNALYDAEGRFTLFPYWENLLEKLYPDPLKPAKCNTLALTGAIGLGKSTEAVIIGIYELYRMLCLKDPYVYYGLQPIDLITFAVINITKDAAHGVAWNKLQSMIQSSPWFLEHGTVNKADVPEWKPPKGIELIYGSQTRHVIGRAVYWCLDGDTVIKTTEGEFKIKELEDKPLKVYNITTDGEALISDLCTVKMTGEFTEGYNITLEDGTIINCTPNHRFMLIDGTYKEAKYLTPEDELKDFNF